MKPLAVAWQKLLAGVLQGPGLHLPLATLY